jgi:hypothetical protein
MNKSETMNQNQTWNSPESAPCDGTPILGDFGWPWPCFAVWDPYDEEWNIASIQASPMADGPDNYWIEATTEKKADLKRWLPMPPLPQSTDNTPP